MLNGFTMDGVVIIYMHRAELEQLEFDPVLSHALLAEKDGTF
jgi:hypothetical protein